MSFNRPGDAGGKDSAPPADAPYVILVEFDLKEGARDAFMPLMLENARRSLADEPGCLVFDVLSRADEPGRVVLYEVYIDKAAFQEHLRAPHFLSFDAAVGAHIAAKRVTEFRAEDRLARVDEGVQPAR